MRFKWMVPGAVALLALVLAILLSQGAGQAQSPLADLEVGKTVDPQVIAPDEFVIYTVTLTNTTGTALEVSEVVDTLPSADFEYVGLAPGHEWVEPTEVTPTEIRWSGPITVPTSGLRLRYYIYVPADVPLSPDPYINTVVATYMAGTYESQAGLLVGVGEVSVDKAADPGSVGPGDLVTYTVAFHNSGYVPVPLATVSDELPAGVTFVEMTADSDISTPPSGVTGIISWTDAYTIPIHGDFVVGYRAATPVTSDTLSLVNEAWGELADSTMVGPASAEVIVSSQEATVAYLPFVARQWAAAEFEATMTADPTMVYATAPGELVTYTVEFTDIGTEAGVLADIRDTLPPGFAFVQMMPGSGVTVPPAGSTGEIVWSGPFVVPGGSTLRLIFQARASTTPAVYVNSATATVSQGLPLKAPATATVEVLEPYLLQENFSNPSPYWEPFLNYWRLKPEQWYYMAGGGPDGSTALRHNYALGVADPDDGAHDALFMYQGPDSEQWTDYVFRTRAVIFADDGSGRGQFGVWFRGTYEEHPLPGRWVTGYYFSMDPYPTKHVYLWQLRTDDECGDDCAFNYHFSNPLLLESLDGRELTALGIDLVPGSWYWLKVEVDGPQIRCYIDDILVFDYYDNVGTTFEQGTIGFFTYIAADARFDDVSVMRLP